MDKDIEDLNVVFGFVHNKAEVEINGERGWLVWDSFLYHEISFIGMNTEEPESLFTSYSGFEAAEKYKKFLTRYLTKSELTKMPSSKRKRNLRTNIYRLENLNDLLAEVHNLIGLNEMKRDLEKHINLVKVQKIREEHGLPKAHISSHLVFLGNPGTGKTTVARMLSKIYHELGILSKGHLIETDRSGLVAGYIGHTAQRVHNVVEQALGGILFIDEAYSLIRGGEKDFGREAIDTLIKLMEDHREDLIIIVAGYPKEMHEFIESNPGMRSRFNKYIYFDDYNESELQQIFELMIRDAGYTLSNDAKQKSVILFKNMLDKKDSNFGNGREVRNIFEKIIGNQASRIIKKKSPSRNDLAQITSEDFKNVCTLE